MRVTIGSRPGGIDGQDFSRRAAGFEDGTCRGARPNLSTNFQKPQRGGVAVGRVADAKLRSGNRILGNPDVVTQDDHLLICCADEKQVTVILGTANQKGERSEQDDGPGEAHPTERAGFKAAIC